MIRDCDVEDNQVGIAMRRTSISLAIVALLLCGHGFSQVISPLGENLAPGATQPLPGTLLPMPDAAVPVPPAVPSAPSAVPQSSTTPQAGLQAGLQAGQQAEQPTDVNPSMLQPQPMPNGYPTTEGPNIWNQPMPGGPCEQACAFPGCTLCGAGTGCPKNWYVDQRLRIMTHPRPRAKAFGEWLTYGIPTSLNPTGEIYTAATSSRSLPFDLSTSYEFTLGKYLGLDTYNRDHFLEFTFYGTNHWGEGGSVIKNATNVGYLDANGNVVSSQGNWVLRGLFGNIYGGRDDAAGFNRASAQWSEYKSSLNNFEVNLQIRPRAKADRLVLHKNGKWRRQCQEGIFCNWLAGARLFSMNESYMFYSTADFTYYDTNGNVVGAGKSTGAYQTRTHNTLLGLQIGPDWTYRKCRAEFGLGVKAAAYVNFAEQETGVNISGAEADLFSDQQNLNINGTVAKNTSATSIQMNFHAAYKVRPNFILRADYELLYMVGLALAPEQVDMGLDQSLDIGTGGALLFQSAKLGAEYSW